MSYRIARRTNPFVCPVTGQGGCTMETIGVLATKRGADTIAGGIRSGKNRAKYGYPPGGNALVYKCTSPPRRVLHYTETSGYQTVARGEVQRAAVKAARAAGLPIGPAVNAATEAFEAEWVPKRAAIVEWATGKKTAPKGRAANGMLRRL